MSENSSVPELLKQARKNEVKFFLQFGGQGTSYLRQMKDLYVKWPQMKDYFHTAFEAIAKMMTRPDIQETRHIFFPYGFHLEKWIMGENVPPFEYLTSAPVSFPCNQITQLAYYYLLDKEGLDMQEVLAHTSATTGHSQGLQAAVAIALGRYKDDFLDILWRFVQWFGVAGFLLQRAYGIAEIDDDILNRSYALDNQAPSSMCVVAGMNYDQLNELVEKFNNTHDVAPLTISLHNGPELFVLCGHGDDMFQFREYYYSLWAENNWAWNYLDVSAPFHRDDFFAYALPQLINDDISKLFPFTGKDLVVPVISFYDGQNLQEKEDLNLILTETMAFKPLYWEKAIHPLFEDKDITHVLDFGPGKISSMLTKNLLGENKKQVIAITGSTNVKKLLS